jgi:hypothetical protein
LLISLTLALAGGALTVFRGSPVAHIDLGIAPLVLAVVVGVLFAGGEMALMNIEFRRQAYSFTLAGVPLALGVLILPTRVAPSRCCGNASSRSRSRTTFVPTASRPHSPARRRSG